MKVLTPVALLVSVLAPGARAVCVSLAVQQPSPRLFSVGVAFSASGDCPQPVSRVGLTLSYDSGSGSFVTASSLTVFECALGDVSTFLAVPASLYAAAVGQSFVVEATTWLVSNESALGVFETATSLALTLQSDDAFSQGVPDAIVACGVRRATRGRPNPAAERDGNRRNGAAWRTRSTPPPDVRNDARFRHTSPTLSVQNAVDLSNPSADDRNVEFVLTDTATLGNFVLTMLTLVNLNGYAADVATLSSGDDTFTVRRAARHRACTRPLPVSVQSPPCVC